MHKPSVNNVAKPTNDTIEDHEWVEYVAWQAGLWCVLAPALPAPPIPRETSDVNDGSDIPQ